MAARRSPVGSVAAGVTAPVLLAATVLLATSCTAPSSVVPATRSATSTDVTQQASTPSPATTRRRPATTVVAIVASSQVAAVRAREPFQDFDEVSFSVTGPDGVQRQFCALLADTEPRREQGLMGRRQLAGYDAMLFAWDGDTTSAFWMRTVPIGLSIAWFAGSGTHVGQMDMEPCGDSDACPRYAAPGPYRWAIETPLGGLEPLGVRSATVLNVGGRCGPPS